MVVVNEQVEVDRVPRQLVDIARNIRHFECEGVVEDVGGYCDCDGEDDVREMY